MAYTLEQYQVLQKAIAGGELSVRYGERSVTYRSVAEMLQILRLMENELGLNADTSGGRRLTSFSKGY